MAGTLRSPARSLRRHSCLLGPGASSIPSQSGMQRPSSSPVSAASRSQRYTGIQTAHRYCGGSSPQGHQACPAAPAHCLVPCPGGAPRAKPADRGPAQRCRSSAGGMWASKQTPCSGPRPPRRPAGHRTPRPRRRFRPLLPRGPRLGRASARGQPGHSQRPSSRGSSKARRVAEGLEQI